MQGFPRPGAGGARVGFPLPFQGSPFACEANSPLDEARRFAEVGLRNTSFFTITNCVTLRLLLVQASDDSDSRA